MKTVALAVLLAWAPMGFAQTAGAPPPPPMPATTTDKATKSAPAKPAPAKPPRRAIELSPAERQAIDARELQAVKPASIEEALQPTPEGMRTTQRSSAMTSAIRPASSSSALRIGSPRSW